ncbi:MAG: hypothetical protein Q7N50_09310 [Armatimonadota bacterium]|nr:hypothetical protein [Armatimonadota bacterium]
MKTLKRITILFSIAIVWSTAVASAPIMRVIEVGPDITTAESPSIAVSAINNASQVVGTISTPYGPRGFIWHNGEMTTMGYLSPVLTDPFSIVIPYPLPIPYSRAHNINDSGQVVGVSGWLGDEVFLWENGQMSHLSGIEPVHVIGLDDRLGVAAINNVGQVVGRYYRDVYPNEDIPCFLWQNGVVVELDRPGVWPSAINDSGVVVGTISPSGGAFLWEDGVFTDMGPSFWTASDVNNLRQVVGMAQDEAYIWEGGSIIRLGHLGSYTSWAGAINDNSQVVGTSFTSSWESHAFIWQDGVMTDLNSLIPADCGWVLAYAKDINESGDIIGHGFYKGESRPFLCKTFDSYISIDVKPGDSSNTINLKSNGMLPVAVLASSDCPIDSIDVGTISLAGAKPARQTRQDVDGDGDEDLLFHFRIPELNLNATSVEANLIGRFSDGRWLVGSDKVKIAGR